MNSVSPPIRSQSLLLLRLWVFVDWNASGQELNGEEFIAKNKCYNRNIYPLQEASP